MLDAGIGMAISHNPSRPCGTKTRARNRYTQQELRSMAFRQGISIRHRSGRLKTMDVLCREITNNRRLSTSDERSSLLTAELQQLKANRDRLQEQLDAQAKGKPIVNQGQPDLVRQLQAQITDCDQRAREANIKLAALEAQQSGTSAGKDAMKLLQAETRKALDANAILKKVESQLSGKDANIAALRQQLTSKNANFAAKNANLAALKQQFTTKNANLKQQSGAKNAIIAAKNAAAGAQQAIIEGKNANIRARNATIAGMNLNIRGKKANIQGLQAQLALSAAAEATKAQVAANLQQEVNKGSISAQEAQAKHADAMSIIQAKQLQLMQQLSDRDAALQQAAANKSASNALAKQAATNRDQVQVLHQAALQKLQNLQQQAGGNAQQQQAAHELVQSQYEEALQKLKSKNSVILQLQKELNNIKNPQVANQVTPNAAAQVVPPLGNQRVPDEDIQTALAFLKGLNASRLVAPANQAKFKNLSAFDADQVQAYRQRYDNIVDLTTKIMGSIFVNVVINRFSLTPVSQANARFEMVERVSNTTVALREKKKGLTTTPITVTYSGFYTVSEIGQVPGYDAEIRLNRVYQDQKANPASLGGMALKAAKGGSVVLFGYGFSGCGKSFTLGIQPGHRGLLQNMVDDLQGLGCTVRMHKVFELYGELQAEKYRVSNFKKDKFEQAVGTQIHDFQCAQTAVRTDSVAKDIDNLIYPTEPGAYRRRTENTINNPVSSRSHLFVVMAVNTANNGTGFLTFVDMGGVENPIQMAASYIRQADREARDEFVYDKVQSAIFSWSGALDYKAKIHPALEHKQTEMRQGFYISQTLVELQYFFRARLGRAQGFVPDAPVRQFLEGKGRWDTGKDKNTGKDLVVYHSNRTFFPPTLLRRTAQQLASAGPALTLDGLITAYADPNVPHPEDPTGMMTTLQALENIGDGATFGMMVVVNPFIKFEPVQAAKDTLKFAQSVGSTSGAINA